MKFLVDAQLPKHLAESAKWWGFDAVHTLYLPEGNATSDLQINEISINDGRVVIPKDADFVSSFVLLGVPYKLLLVSTGNITNKELFYLFEKNMRTIEQALEKKSMSS
jgi:predicted nuclease of predicted toxin-antitoxin system